MKICCLGDIHYYGLRNMLDNIVSSIENDCADVDAIVLVGDLTADGDLGNLAKVLKAIKEVTNVPVLVVPGNHDLYLTPSEIGRINLLTKLSMFNNLVEEFGFIALMKKPSYQ